ncbi:MAG: RNA polymerase sigma factor [Blautia sp.]
MDLEEQYDKIYRYCYFKLHHQQMAEDITQETFLRFLEDNAYYERGQKLRYLYTIAHNLCVDVYRRKQTEPLTDDLLSEDKENEILTSIAIKEALLQLPKEEQEIVFLRYVNEVPVSEICNFLKVSRFFLYRKTKKALKQLQEILGKEDFE